MRAVKCKNQIEITEKKKLTEHFLTEISNTTKINPNNTWNSDETMIRLAMPPKKTNNIKGEKQVLVKSNKAHERMGATVIHLRCCCSITGEKKPATIVMKNRKEFSERLLSELTIPANVNLCSSKSGWMNKSLLTSWYSQNFTGNENHIIDVAGAHKAETFTKHTLNDNIIYIPAGCTDTLQPLDVSVNKAFKDHIRHYYRITKMSKMSSLSQSYRQHMINAVSYSWDKITTEIIKNGFEKSGITASITQSH